LDVFYILEWIETLLHPFIPYLVNSWDFDFLISKALVKAPHTGDTSMVKSARYKLDMPRHYLSAKGKSAIWSAVQVVKHGNYFARHLYCGAGMGPLVWWIITVYIIVLFFDNLKRIYVNLMTFNQLSTK
jgi:hypothetical protein